MDQPKMFPTDYKTDSNTGWFKKPFPRFMTNKPIQVKVCARFLDCAYVHEFTLTLPAGEPIDCFFYPKSHPYIAFCYPVNRVRLEEQHLAPEIRNHSEYAGLHLVLSKKSLEEQCHLIASGEDPICPENQPPNRKGTHRNGWFMIRQEELTNALHAAQSLDQNPVCFQYFNDGVAHIFKIGTKRDTDLIDISDNNHW